MRKILCLIVFVVLMPLALAEGTPASFRLSLSQGWNLVSVPLDITDDGLDDIKLLLGDSLESVFAYVHNETDEGWQFYITGFPDEFNTLDNIDYMQGFWINVNEESEIEIEGYILGDLIYGLRQGWNLMSYPYEEESLIESFFDVSSVYSIYRYNDSGWGSWVYNRPPELNSLMKMSSGHGYWVEMKADLNLTCSSQDSDGDGYDDYEDCAPDDPDINPGADEVCDGLDNDCDDLIDESLVRGCYTGPPGTRNVGECHDGTQTCSIGAWGICEDEVIPVAEACDGLDNDCDGSSDEGNPGGGAYCDTGLQGVCQDGTTTCQIGVLQCVQDVFPSSEACDGLDNDCDGAADDGLIGSLCPLQLGVCDGSRQQCGGASGWLSCDASTYLEHNSNYEVDESSCDSLDNDCDGVVDEGCTVDNDGDGYYNDVDCDDDDYSVHPGADEICDGKDNDCDDDVDAEDSGLILADCELQAGVCEGTFHDAEQCVSGSWQACGIPQYCRSSPCWYGPELCGFGDNDCDGETDEEGSLFCTKYYTDFDSDGYGSDERCLCSPEDPHNVTTGGDCDDDDAGINPGADEVCDGKDNDCDDDTDSADSGLILTKCELQAGVCHNDYHTASQCVSGFWQQCDATNYGSDYGPESCDFKDNDCDAEVDEFGATGCTDKYFDQDADGYGLSSDSECVCPLFEFGYNTTLDGDCNDTNPYMYPGNTEVCDSFDNDCNDEVDECGPSDTDYYEPNDNQSSAWFFYESIEDIEFGSICYGGNPIYLYPPDLEDWYYISINDTQVENVSPKCWIPNIDPNVVYELCIYYDLGKDGSIDFENCTMNVDNNKPWYEDPENFVTLDVESGGDDSGYFYMRLKRISGISCSRYRVCFNY